MEALSERSVQHPWDAGPYARSHPGLMPGLLAAGVLMAAAAGAYAFEAPEAHKPAVAAASQSEDPNIELPLAPVELDGAILFRVRGISSYPAEQRAAAIARRIEQAAQNASILPNDIATREVDLGTAVTARDHILALMTDADARVEGFDRKTLARAYAARIREAVVEYRSARTPRALTTSALRTGAATLALAAILALLLTASRRIARRIDSRTASTSSAVRVGSFELIGADHLGRFLRATLLSPTWSWRWSRCSPGCNTCWARSPGRAALPPGRSTTCSNRCGSWAAPSSPRFRVSFFSRSCSCSRATSSSSCTCSSPPCGTATSPCRASKPIGPSQATSWCGWRSSPLR